MTKIHYQVPSELTNIEGKFKLTFFRERKDIAGLLTELKNGRKLIDIFRSNSISNALFKNLLEGGYIDNNQNITSKGQLIINHPLIAETEKGTYSIDFSKIALLDGDYSIITNIKRKLSDEKRLLTPYQNRLLIRHNQIIVDNDSNEFTTFDSLDLYGEQRATRVMESSTTKSEVKFDILDKKYKFGDKWLLCGDDLYIKLKSKVEQLILTNDYGHFDLNLVTLTIISLKDFSESDLIKGQLSKFNKDGVTIENIPISIKDENQALEYAYLYAYYKLKGNNYLSFMELDEMFQNEILTKDIFEDSVKRKLASFSYSMNGFRQYLSDDKFKTLAYKLSILEYLLDIKIQNNEFSSAHSYDQLLKLFEQEISSSEVNKVYFVLGYPFVKNQRNKIIEAMNLFKKSYKDIVIVQKGNIQTKDQKIESDVINMGINIVENSDILKSFHDRYILFSLKNGKFVSYLMTCEYGQYFSQDHGTVMGSIIKIDSKELKKDKFDLLQMVRG